MAATGKDPTTPPPAPAAVTDEEKFAAFLDSPEFQAKVGALLAGELARINKALEDEFKPLLEALEAKAAAETAEGVEAAIRFAHVRIDAVKNALERAVGINVPMPTAPDEIVTKDVTVAGAEAVG